MKVVTLIFGLVFLAAITSSVEIQCSYSFYNYFNGGWPYACRATVISMENPTVVTDITGIHLEGQGNADVQWFDIRDHELFTTMPEGVEIFFPNLEAFDWTGGNVSNFDSSIFGQYKNLVRIALSRNKIVTLEGDLRQHTPKLKEFYLERNLLEHVGVDLLTGLTYLTNAYFNGNPCIDMTAYTPQQMEELKIQLSIRCPPLSATPDPPTTTISTTTESKECSIRCTLNEEVDEMKNRIEELEKQMREVNSNPCTCNPN